MDSPLQPAPVCKLFSETQKQGAPAGRAPVPLNVAALGEEHHLEDGQRGLQEDELQHALLAQAHELAVHLRMQRCGSALMLPAACTVTPCSPLALSCSRAELSEPDAA